MATKTTRLTLLAYKQNEYEKQLLADVKALLPLGTTVYYRTGHHPTNSYTVKKIDIIGGEVRLWITNPRSGKSRWVGYSWISGVEEPGYQLPDKPRPIYSAAWELAKPKPAPAHV